MNRSIRRGLAIFALGFLGGGVLQFGAERAQAQEEPAAQPSAQAASARQEPWDAETIALFQTLPVQEDGRVKPLDTYAGFKLLKLNGKRSCVTPGPRKEKLKPVSWLLDCLFFPEAAKEYEVFLVQNSEVFDRLGQPEVKKEKRDRYTYNQLAPTRQALFTKAHEYSQIEAKLRDPVQGQIVDLATNLSEFEELTGFLDFARQPLPVRGSEGLRQIFTDPGRDRLSVVLEKARFLLFLNQKLSQSADVPEDRKDSELGAIRDLVHQVDRYAARAGAIDLFPPAQGAEQDEWMSPADLVHHSFIAEHGPRRQVELLAELEALEAAKGDRAAFKSKLSELHGGLTELADQRGEYDKIPLEVSFYRWDFFYRGLLLYLLAFLLSAISWLVPPEGRASRVLDKGVWGCLGLATVLVVAGITLRCVIRGRPPVSTLYETILFITATGVMAAMAIEWINRQRVALAMATVLGAAGMFLAGSYEAHEAQDTMPQLVAVLDTNFWLATHVTTVTLGYSAGLLAAAIAHVWLLGKVFAWARGLLTGKPADPKASRAFYRTVARMVYGTICFGLLFSIVGTILGGIWANYSWGRFWGWDPKENGALLIVLWELMILHARLGGYIRDHGLCVLAVLGGMVVAFSWWGVNLLGVGLHSYGFTSGVKMLLTGFYGVELGVVALSGLWWLVQLGVEQQVSGGDAAPAGEAASAVAQAPAETQPVAETASDAAEAPAETQPAAETAEAQPAGGDEPAPEADVS